MTREEAIRHLHTYSSTNGSGRTTQAQHEEAKRMAIKALEQPEPQWIPVSERLPEIGTYVLISKKALNFRSNLPSVCTAHRSCDPRSGKEEWNDMLFGKLDDDDVLAWMPLPEPYRGE